ncbi:hypothetical protein COT42_05385 [Candidatus Saganbacteria bacterium CG08_land_8_20_14_0_20_45_16]|uniref:N-acetyltransferase domain-containing protein n=1 Tax=Candidatus Saganbacteria bacterium CG08_land_8_20_14_0_20_45_16 TaxID=2014293 RepID=A0A2H0XYZ3_UNCSA|nr:MAG: hypothetical protein COT42_05385 [Candidatus Saganbacteria bacterium CG08_land_8_20_14_0_20_45_16]
MFDLVKATKEDGPAIINLLQDVDSYYSELKLENFWLFKAASQLVAVIQLNPYPDFVFLSSLAVTPKNQHQKIASQLLAAVLKNTIQDIYLYTIIPDFFKKLGWQIIDQPKVKLPGKEPYECHACQPQKCVTIVKYASPT